MGKTFSYDALDDDFVEDEYEMLGRNQLDKNKQKVK
ncbi:MAG: PA3496 family putative envelope integrity protein, partial [Pseudoalteromonas nigrifaciens]